MFTIADVGIVSPGVLEPVFAACCVTCARVDLFPVAQTAEEAAHRPIAKRSGHIEAARIAMGAGWRQRVGDAIQPRPWQCPGCQPPKLPGFGR